MSRIPFIRSHDGGSLRQWLVSIVMLPVIGVGVVAGIEVTSHVSTVRSDRHVEELVQGTVDINRVRTDLLLELLPALTGSLVTNPQLRAGLGLTPVQTGKLQSTIAQVPALRAGTDAAIATLDRRSDLRSLGVRMRNAVSQMRTTIDSGTYPHTAFNAGITILGDLAAAQNNETAVAIRYGLDPASVQALIDLAMVSRAVQFAGELAPFFVSSQFPGVVAPTTTAQALWVQTWGSFQAWSTAILEQASPATHAVWKKAINHPLRAPTDAIYSSTVPNPKSVGTAATLSVVLSDPARNELLSGAEAATVALVLNSARAQQAEAVRALAFIMLVCLLVILVSLLAARRAQRALTNPLNRLADEADQVSQGELVDVGISGPHEVRTVARGLAASVTSLRTIQAQAMAVAAGDLDSPVVANPVPGALGAVVHASVLRIVSAIRDRERAQSELAHRAAHDPLTELPNRGQALSLVENALHRAERAGSMTGLMFVDLDHFKAVNDNFGHAAGDEVLLTMARRMKGLMRGGDTVARLGGDEFVVLMESIREDDDCLSMAQRIVDAASIPIEVGRHQVHIGASVGIAICRGGHIDGDRLLREADAAVYRAKSAGRGQIGVFDDDLHAELADRFALDQALLAAIDNDEFELHYQPVIDLEHGLISGVEALIRWNRPGYGLVSPDTFIPTAEGSTLINDIDRWVLGTATRQLAEWITQDSALSEWTMSINISGRHLFSPQLPDDVAQALAESGIAPEKLVIEVTETVLVDSTTATQNLQALRRLGVLIAIDDFGTGYTSIGQLPVLPVDIIKIDRSFVGSMAPGNRDLVRLMVTAAHAFGKKVIAEGIEHAEQMRALQEMNVGAAQGFLFAAPMPGSDIVRYARHSARGQFGTLTSFDGFSFDGALTRIPLASELAVDASTSRISPNA